MDQDRIRDFLRESLAIEGIHRDPTEEELDATTCFLLDDVVVPSTVCRLQATYAPGKPIRDRPGMNVRVGSHIPIPGGPEVAAELAKLCRRVGRLESDPWLEHVAFETLHPFMDGNGRTGRALWALHMLRRGRDPFALPFLHRWYYQTLEAQQRIRRGEA